MNARIVKARFVPAVDDEPAALVLTLDGGRDRRRRPRTLELALPLAVVHAIARLEVQRQAEEHALERGRRAAELTGAALDDDEAAR